jgi:hypothetical protein
VRKFNLPEPIFWMVTADKNKAIEFFVDRIRSRDKAADGSDEKDSQPSRQSSKVRHSLVSVLPISTACTEDKDLLDLEFMAKCKPESSRKRYSLGLPNPFSAGLSSERKPAPKNNQVLQQLNNSSQQMFIN